MKLSLRLHRSHPFAKSAKGWGTHFIADASEIKSLGHHAGLGNLTGYYGTALELTTTSSSSVSGSGMAIAPERRCGLGFNGAGTGASGSPRAGGPVSGSATARLAAVACWFFFLALRLRLSRPFPISAYGQVSRVPRLCTWSFVGDYR